MQPQAFGVGHRIQRKGVLCGAGHSEEVRPCTRRHHQVRPLQRPPVGERETACGQVRGGHLRGHHLDRGVFGEDGPVGPGDVLGGQLGAGDLVEQRLELVVVIAVNQCYLHTVITQLERTGHASKPATKNQHPSTHPKRPPRGRSGDLRQPLIEDDPRRSLDQREMGERLRKVAEMSTGVDVEFLGEKPKRRGDS